MLKNRKSKRMDVMGEKNHPFVIAIAGVSGGGKTTITERLIQELHNSKALYFDDYDFDGPEDIISRVENGPIIINGI